MTQLGIAGDHSDTATAPNSAGNRHSGFFTTNFSSV